MATAVPRPTAGFARARRKFLRIFPDGFRDPKYLDWERDYKWESHRRWISQLNQADFRRLLHDRAFDEIAKRALGVEQRSRHSMIFTFEKIALREAIRGPGGARRFATALYDFLHGRGAPARRFDDWVGALRAMPRSPGREKRLVTWPVATVFGFLAQPRTHFFLKPLVTRRAAQVCQIDFPYRAQPSAAIYENVLALATTTRRWLLDLHPRDMIDIQSFLWVQGSDEY